MFNDYYLKTFRLPSVVQLFGLCSITIQKSTGSNICLYGKNLANEKTHTHTQKTTTYIYFLNAKTNTHKYKPTIVNKMNEQKTSWILYNNVFLLVRQVKYKTFIVARLNLLKNLRMLQWSGLNDTVNWDIVCLGY